MKKTGMGFWTFHPKTKCSFWATETFRLFGFGAMNAPIKIKDVLARIHPDDRPSVVSSVELLGQKPYDVEYRFTRPDGQVRHMHSVSVPTPDVDSDAVLGIVQDITDVRQRDRDFEDIRQRYEMISENIEDMVTVSEPNGQLVYVSSYAVELLAWQPTEIIGRFVSDFIHPDESPMLATCSERIRRGESIGRQIFRLRRRDGSYVWTESTVKVIRDAVGNVLRQIAVTRDVTDRLRREEELHRSKDTLERAQRLSHIGNWEFNFLTGELYWSEEVHCIFGFPPDLRMNFDRLIQSVHPDDVDKVLEAKRCAIQGLTHDLEYRIFRPNGDERVIHAQGEGVYENDEIVAAVGVLHDITQRKLTERALQESQMLLQKSDKLSAVGQLAAGIAHEIRNPLTSLKGFTQLMNTQATSETRPFFDLMMDELNRIQSILGELLVLAKPQVTHHIVCPIGTILHDVVALLSAQAVMQDVVIDVQLDDDIPEFCCDPNQLKQVFVNVIKNALEAMETGGVLTIQAELDRSEIVTRIIDTGIGIPSDAIPRLGDPFYTTKETGTGLGLLMTQRIVATHNGQLIIDSVVGEGTTVTVRLPVVGDPSAFEDVQT